MNTARETHTRSVVSGTLLMETVGIPALSISRWTSPTDRTHRGQTGTNTAAPTPSSRILAIILGTVRFTRGWKFGM